MLRRPVRLRGLRRQRARAPVERPLRTPRARLRAARAQARLPVRVEHEVRLPGLDPAHDGVRIVQLSDVHVGRTTPAAHVRAAVELANASAADLIVLTGDYVCYARDEIALMRDQLGGLRAPRVIATLGNHDYWCDGDGVAAAMVDAGYRVLRNAWETVELNGAPVHVVGVDDPITRRHDLDRAFRGVPAGGTRVALCHGPELADRIAARGADLILSGHTHGGQIFIAGITDKIIERFGLRYRSGFYRVGRSTLYVTPGIGSASVPWRVGRGTRAEVVVHTLRRA
jgi:predicted MPP superfamily phosphohydrolase